MIARTFHAGSVTGALRAVKKELGGGARIVSIRKTPPQPGRPIDLPQEIEVVAVPATESPVNPPAPADEQISVRKAAAPHPDFGREAGPAKQLADAEGREHIDLSALKDESPITKESIRRAPGLPQHLAGFRDRLLTQGVNPAIVERVMQSALEALSPEVLMHEAPVQDYLRTQLQSGIRTDSGGCLLNNRVVCLIGASGVGKTSAAAKLAAYAVKTLDRRATWITTDTLRAGAIAKAQAFTAPLGIPLRLAYTPEEMAAIIKAEIDSDLILVDTPGCNPYRKEDLQALGDLLQGISTSCILLVISATSKEEDVRAEWAAFSPFHIQGLIFSKLDETKTYGCPYNFALFSRLPISFFTLGIRMHGDLRPADRTYLVNELLGMDPENS